MTHTDSRGKLTVVEQTIPFPIQRIFYLYALNDSLRGGHRHKRTSHAIICLKGKCRISNNDGHTSEEFLLENPETCLLLEPRDWHQISPLTDETIIMVLASEKFDPEDYVFEPYP